MYIGLILAVPLGASGMNVKWHQLIAMGTLHRGLAVLCSVFGDERSKTSQTLISFPDFASNFALTATEAQLLQGTEHCDVPKILACNNCLSFSHTTSTGYHISVPPLVALSERATKQNDAKSESPLATSRRRACYHSAVHLVSSEPAAST